MKLLQPGQGPIPTDAYVRSSPGTLRWGRLPTADTTPVARLASGDAITFDTVSHEGLLGDQGADAVAFFGGWGIQPDEVLDDVRDLAGTALGRQMPHDGPHAVLGPVEVAGARVGDVLCIETLALDFRAPYGIVSNRHGRGVLAGELPRADADSGEPPAVVSTLARVDDDGRGRIDTPSGHALRFDLRPFLGLVGVTPAEPEAASSTPPGRHGGNLVRNAAALVVDRTGVDEQSALAFLSAAADFEISQAVNLVVGVHCLIRTTDLDG